MPAATAKQIESAVAAALERCAYDEAANIAAGHPDQRKHGELMVEINLRREPPAVPESGATVPESGTTALDVTSAQPAPAGMFRLVNHPATLSSYNPRAEQHGERPTPAADLKFEANLPSTVLDHFDPLLRAVLFHKAEEARGLLDAAHDAPNLRFPKLGGPLKWSNEFAGYALRIHLGTSEKSHLVINDCDLNAITFTPQEGGTVVVTFRIQCHPDEKQSGKLAMLVANRVDVTLSPPSDGEDELPLAA